LLIALGMIVSIPGGILKTAVNWISMRFSADGSTIYYYIARAVQPNTRTRMSGAEPGIHVSGDASHAGRLKNAFSSFQACPDSEKTGKSWSHQRLSGRRTL